MLNTYKTTRPVSGEFQIFTKKHAYWVKAKQGIIVDLSPCLRSKFLYQEVTELLKRIYAWEGVYTVRRIIRD